MFIQQSYAGFKKQSRRGSPYVYIVTTTMGMIRLFLYDGTNTRLFREFPIPAVTQSATEPTYEFKTSLGNFNLNPGWAVKATTANTESMSIIAEGNDWKYPA